MIGYEYWLDTDYSNKVSNTVSNEKTAILSIEVKTDHLSEGIHILNFRASDSKGRWSSPVTKYFYNFIEKEANEVEEYEYWLDTGYDKKIVGACSGSLISDIDVSSLSEGMHFINIRFKDKRGQWSSTLVHYFYHFPVKEQNQVVAYEYWFDTNYANCQRGNTEGAFSQELDVSSLSEGMHFMNLRFKDKRGQWSSPVVHYFYYMKEREPNEIVMYEYWIDQDFNGRKQEESPGGALSLNLDFRHLENGNHVLYFRVKDKRGQWSSPVVAEFEKIDGIIPDIPEDEIAILRQLYEKTGGNAWTEKWDTEETLANDTHWKGVSFDEEGHVVALTLPDNNLSGALPKSVFELPKLLRLDMSQNANMGGTLNEILTLEKSNGTLEEIKLQGTNLSGYVPELEKLPGLKVADFSGNRLDSVSPKISVGRLLLNDQSLQISPIDLVQYPELSLPAISRYDVEKKTFDSYPDFKGMNVSGKNGLTFTYDQAKKRYLVKNDQGKVDLQIQSEEKIILEQLNGAAKGSRADGFGVRWQLGDVCVDDFSEPNRINVLDALLTARYAVGMDLNKEDNDPSLLFNVLAANVYSVGDEDETTVNVQDVVSIVNMVLDTPPAEASLLKSAMDSPNSLWIEDGKLVLKSSEPVAALDFLLSGCKSSQFRTLVPAGYMVMMRDVPDGLRVLILSLTGDSLPTGRTDIATVNVLDALLSNAIVVSDKNAKIPVTLNRESSATGIEVVEGVHSDDGYMLVVPAGAIEGNIYLYNLSGQCVGRHRLDDMSSGMKDLRPYCKGLSTGVYILRVEIRTDKGVSVSNRKLNIMN